MLNRLRADFQLTIITLFAACTIFLILPFAVHRFLIGQLVAGIVDSTIVLCISAAALYAWRSGDTRRSGFFLVFVTTAGTMAAATILGVAGVFWMYATLLLADLVGASGCGPVSGQRQRSRLCGGR